MLATTQRQYPDRRGGMSHAAIVYAGDELSLSPFRSGHHRPVKSTWDPRDVPLYSVSQAATFIGVSVTALKEWVRPGTDDVQPRRPLLHLADTVTERLSFANLLDAHILEVTRKYHIPSADVQSALVDAQAYENCTTHPLLSTTFCKQGKRRFVEFLSEAAATAEREKRPSRRRLEFKERLLHDLRRHLNRIDRDENGDPYQVFPVRRNQNGHVVLNVNLLAGHPVLAGTGIRVEYLRGLYDRGTSVQEIAEEYDLDRPLSVELSHSSPKYSASDHGPSSCGAIAASGMRRAAH
jgi:uncharacterized protein (DUF433 family)